MADRTPEVGTEKGVECCPQTRLGQWAWRKGPKCLPSNNAEPMLRNTKSSELIRGFQPADAVLTNISRRWIALAHQLESLAVIAISEGK
jgi:hypothetical protein